MQLIRSHKLVPLQQKCVLPYWREVNVKIESKVSGHVKWSNFRNTSLPSPYTHKMTKPRRRLYVAGLEVLTAVTMKSTVFRVVKPCSLERLRRFGGTYASIQRIEYLAKEETNRIRRQDKRNLRWKSGLLDQLKRQRNCEKPTVEWPLSGRGLIESAVSESPCRQRLRFHLLSHSYFRAWTGLCQPGFFTRGLLSLPPASVDFLLVFPFDLEEVGNTFWLSPNYSATQKNHTLQGIIW
jgi:hypothetical protein